MQDADAGPTDGRPGRNGTGRNGTERNGTERNGVEVHGQNGGRGAGWGRNRCARKELLTERKREGNCS